MSTTHNDLHLGNILVDKEGMLWIIDFDTVRPNRHALLDVSKWYASALFLHTPFEADSTDERHLRELVRMLATVPEDLSGRPPAAPHGVSAKVAFVWDFVFGSLPHFLKYRDRQKYPTPVNATSANWQEATGKEI